MLCQVNVKKKSGVTFSPIVPQQRFPRACDVIVANIQHTPWYIYTEKGFVFCCGLISVSFTHTLQDEFIGPIN